MRCVRASDFKPQVQNRVDRQLSFHFTSSGASVGCEPGAAVGGGPACGCIGGGGPCGICVKLLLLF